MTKTLPILLILSHFSFVSSEMWMHITVQQVVRKPCPIDETSWGTETAGCATMSYMTIDERILPHHERRSSSFEHLNGVLRPTVTHWPKGRVADWMMSVQFVSVDPVYGLARTCDRSGYIRVFQNETDGEKEFVERVVQIQGQCFTAAVLIEASRDVCPWCVDSSKTTTPPTTTVAPTTVAASLISSDNRILMVILVALAVFSFCALLATIALLVVFICDRRRKRDDLFEIPPPQANSTIMGDRRGDPFTTKSSEKWAELTDTWQSFRPYDMENRETLVYKVTHTDDDSGWTSQNSD